MGTASPEASVAPAAAQLPTSRWPWLLSPLCSHGPGEMDSAPRSRPVPVPSKTVPSPRLDGAGTGCRTAGVGATSGRWRTDTRGVHVTRPSRWPECLTPRMQMLLGTEGTGLRLGLLAGAARRRAGSGAQKHCRAGFLPKVSAALVAPAPASSSTFQPGAGKENR